MMRFYASEPAELAEQPRDGDATDRLYWHVTVAHSFAGRNTISNSRNTTSAVP
jgi:hypothetical protein